MQISIENIREELGINDAQKALEITRLISGKRSPRRYQSVRSWIAESYSEPENYEQVMKAIDEILETCGVEALFEEELPFGEKADKPFALYCNTGDSYASTILYWIEKNEYSITSWADAIELKEKESNEESEGQYKDDILAGLASSFWAFAWAQHVNEAKCERISENEITDVMPDMPNAALQLAEEISQRLIAENSDCSLDLLYRNSLRNNINEGIGYSEKRSGPKAFGFSLGCEILGSGLSWSDDNAEHGLSILRNKDANFPLVSTAEETCLHCHPETEDES